MDEGFKNEERLFKLVNDMRVDIARLPEKLMEKTDKRYAAKWAENAWIAVFSVVGGCLLISAVTILLT